MRRLLPVALSLLVFLPLPALAAPLPPYWVVGLSQRDDSGLFFDWLDAGFTAKDVNRDGIISDSEVFDARFFAGQGRSYGFSGEFVLPDTQIGAPQITLPVSGWVAAVCSYEQFLGVPTGQFECNTIWTGEPFAEYVDVFVPRYERDDLGLQTYNATWTRVIPLPPAGFLLLGALAGMALVGRRARRAQAKA